MTRRLVCGVLVAGLTLGWAVPAIGQGNADNGRLVFSRKCASCHTVSVDGAHSPKGPNLAGVIGRPAGSIPGWVFSPALRASGLEFHPRHRQFLVWTEANLDQWLRDPSVFVPGSQMDLKLSDRGEREDVIAYLGSVSPPAPRQGLLAKTRFIGT